MRSRTFSQVHGFRVVAAVVLVSVLGAACSSSERSVGSEATSKTSSDRGVVMLQGVGGTDVDPFSDSVTVVEVEDFGPAVRSAIAGVFTDADTDPSTGTRFVSGDTPGLYGGSGDDAVCDLPALADFLAQPEAEGKSEAFADTVGVDVEDLADFLAGLTPVVLTADTLVTNHGYSNGKSTPFPAVLQAGTAVAVDGDGIPRVKCGCGNPLGPAGSGVEIGPDTSTTGEAWDGYEPAEVTTVEPADDEIDEFTVIDVETGTMYEIPSGSSPADDPDSDNPDDCFIDADGHGPDCDPAGTGSAPGSGGAADDCFIDADGHGPDCGMDGQGGADDLRYLSGWDATAAGFGEYTMFTVTCEPNGAIGAVYGSGPYELSSSLCTAAVHSGRITAAVGGTVGGQVVPVSGSMGGSTANGVTSQRSNSPSGAFEIF